MIRFRRRQWQPTPVLLPGNSHGWRSLVGCSPWGPYESDATEQLRFHFSLSRNGEGNGNPLQCSCLENPRDRGAWWAAVYGVARSQTRLTQLSSSSSIGYYCCRSSWDIMRRRKSGEIHSSTGCAWWRGTIIRSLDSKGIQRKYGRGFQWLMRPPPISLIDYL